MTDDDADKMTDFVSAGIDQLQTHKVLLRNALELARMRIIEQMEGLNFSSEEIETNIASDPAFIAIDYALKETA